MQRTLLGIYLLQKKGYTAR